MASASETRRSRRPPPARGEARKEARRRRAERKKALRDQKALYRATVWQDAKNLPNLLTFARVLMIPAVLYLLSKGGPRDCVWAAMVYALAAITDFVDGYLARKMNLISVLGKFLDPLADKLIVACTLVWLVSMGRIPAWAVALLLSREITITALRSIASAEGLVIAAGDGGKVKTALQMVGILCLIIGYPYPLWMGIDLGVVDLVHVGRLLVYGSLFYSLWSGADYFAVFFQAIEKEKGTASSR